MSPAKLTVAFLLLTPIANVAFAQTMKDDTWCKRCFVYNGEQQVSSSAFDKTAVNNCGVPITLKYRRQVGDGVGKGDETWSVGTGAHSDRCNGSRKWLCTPIESYSWECPANPKASVNDNLQDRLKSQAKKAEEAPAKKQAYEKQVLDEETKAISQRDSELAAARKDVAERQKADQANRAAEKAKADAARAKESPPIIPPVVKSKYPSMSTLEPQHLEPGYVLYHLKRSWLDRVTCELKEDERVCKFTGNGWSSYTRGRCFDIKEYHLAYLGHDPALKGQGPIDVLCFSNE
ncbi:cell envelope integrity protein TolA [Bradyrhizobium erythrophlei]|uniref:Uncharacterized protein n=1 Tax=Bradyrhizobium erythrophlei TaxID=1437360 RepID=A0A1H4P1W6_9BRAD|nr:cell envelope integrity protein TolA [Bradyrhizobium erythrophlei]SEC01324.1 hypothetical protein SAMN05444164_0798 [Bradyrhizobium erythrophlei]